MGRHSLTVTRKEEGSFVSDRLSTFCVPSPVSPLVKQSTQQASPSVPNLQPHNLGNFPPFHSIPQTTTNLPPGSTGSIFTLWLQGEHSRGSLPLYPTAPNGRLLFRATRDPSIPPTNYLDHHLIHPAQQQLMLTTLALQSPSLPIDSHLPFRPREQEFQRWGPLHLAPTLFIARALVSRRDFRS